MFYEESEILFKETQKMLKEAEKVSREENKKIDDEWLKKVNTTMNLISSNSNDFRSVSEVVSSAKKERNYLLEQLSLYFNNTEKQTKISQRLVNLNNVIASYENALQEKEDRKLEFLKNKKTDIVSSMLDELIKNVDKEIKKISSKVDSKMEELRSLSGQADFKKVTKELNILNEKLINFSNLNNSLNSLKTYNGNVISDKKLTELTANLTKEDKKLVTACYNLIISNRINLRKLSPSPKRVIPNNDKKLDEAIKAVEKVEKSIAENNFNPAEFVDAYNKVNALKDGKEKEELLKRLDAITNKLADCLNDHLKDLEKIDIKTIDDVDKIESGKINSVVSLFDFLVKDRNVYDLFDNLSAKSLMFNEAMQLMVLNGFVKNEDLIALIHLINIARKNNKNLYDIKYHTFIRTLSGAYVTLKPNKYMKLSTQYYINNLRAFELGNCRYCNAPYIFGKEVNGYLHQNSDVDIYENYGDNENISVDYYLLSDSIDEESVNTKICEEDILCGNCGYVYNASNKNAKQCDCSDDYKVKYIKLTAQHLEITFLNVLVVDIIRQLVL